MKNRIDINFNYILSTWIKINSIIFTIIGIIGTFISIPDIVKTKHAVEIILGILTVSLVASVIYALWFNNCITAYTTSQGKNVFVKYGNILDKNIIKDAKKKIVVIPVNRCFDVIANDELIAKTSIHGQCLDLLVPNKYSIEALNEKIQKQLELSKIKFDILDKKDKNQGNLKRYPAGTVAQIEIDNTIYYFLALSYFDSNLHANTNDSDYNDAVNGLLQYYNIHSQGYPIAIPLIGAGASNTKKGQVDILNYLISLLKINNNYINSDVYVIVNEKQKNNIAIANII